ncbi:hypothetical protein TI24_20630 [Vibrio vulnificus]|nr:hypothetical protein VVCECT4999_14650 [Vibrio vulnificus]KGK68165.1 hypothetical protein NA76_22705 [Vibrio vulnificus]PNG67985.1 hypothetical protein TI24_20630 [Vibrio vulnificus]PNG72931.1 hypothetical protein TI31_21830 [Vibrio vulnificus]POB74642.1 hypothetical protein CRN62_04220 [Vibrio vulnificus]
MAIKPTEKQIIDNLAIRLFFIKYLNSLWLMVLVSIIIKESAKAIFNPAFDINTLRLSIKIKTYSDFN